MHSTMMPAAKWDRKLIADLTAERTRLHEAEVVRVRGPAAAHQARLLGDIAKVLAVAVATRSGD
jgi:ribosomal protein L15E